jgi:hypothetical protein
MPQIKFGKANRFEGWYFKLVDASEKNALAVIPGVSFGEDEFESHAFVQVLDARGSGSHYASYPIDAFESAKDQFQIRIGPNEFSLNDIKLDITEAEHEICGNITLGEMIPWPVTRRSPGAMGPFRFVPGMQCLHGVLGFDHEVGGSIRIDNRTVDLSGGRGYVEKDWGKEFPSAWIWMQSNHFEKTGVSFTASIANIPWMGRSFAGFIIGLLYDGEVHRFATYTRADLSQPEVSESKVAFSVKDSRYLLDVQAERAEGALLRSPVEGLMTGRIVESLDSSIHLRFYDTEKSDTKPVFEGTGRNAGLEVVGDLAEIEAVEV